MVADHSCQLTGFSGVWVQNRPGSKRPLEVSAQLGMHRRDAFDRVADALADGPPLIDWPTI
jgi:hypothetical protein